MENLKNKKNKIYSIFCICICLLLWLFSYFDGHIYISSNGYAVLWEQIPNPIWIDQENHLVCNVVHKMTINGKWLYLSYYPISSTTEKLHFYGTGDSIEVYVDFYVNKEDKNFSYTLQDGGYPYEDGSKVRHMFTQNMEMIFDFIVANWHYFIALGFACPEGVSPIWVIFAIVLLFLLRLECLRLVEKKWNGSFKRNVLLRRFCYCIFISLQLCIVAIFVLRFVTFL